MTDDPELCLIRNKKEVRMIKELIKNKKDKIKENESKIKYWRLFG